MYNIVVYQHKVEPPLTDTTIRTLSLLGTVNLVPSKTSCTVRLSDQDTCLLRTPVYHILPISRVSLKRGSTVITDTWRLSLIAIPLSITSFEFSSVSGLKELIRLTNYTEDPPVPAFEGIVDIRENDQLPVHLFYTHPQ